METREQTMHTPGPWEIDAHNDVSGGVDGGPIAHPYRAGVYGLTAAEAQANARLIAAAPDLLEAAKNIEDWLDSAAMVSNEYRALEDDDLRALRQTLQAAITKAENA